MAAGADGERATDGGVGGVEEADGDVAAGLLFPADRIFLSERWGQDGSFA